jgi:bifunctional N-acetylglucosamine-1-phosphate-uridyltransferase/glucosamine-1-phosphate-acetyltransferase GlmU-like protein
VITRDVPPGALAITRPKQRKIDGYAERKAREAKKEGKGS